jgi:hypothetical protein
MRAFVTGARVPDHAFRWSVHNSCVLSTDRGFAASDRLVCATVSGMTGLLLRHDMLRRGMSEDDVRRALRAGEIQPLRPGAYLDPADPRWRDADERHRALTDATFAQLAPGAVVSHVSAAVRHRLPVWGVSLRTVHVTRGLRSGGRGGRRLRTHAAPLRADEIVVIDGLPTTSVARTVADMARHAPFETAVSIADASLHGRSVGTGTP